MKRLAEIWELRLEGNAKHTNIAMFLERLVDSAELVTEFDEELWYATVDFATVYEDMRMVFTFRDGNRQAGFLIPYQCGKVVISEKCKRIFICVTCILWINEI